MKLDDKIIGTATEYFKNKGFDVDDNIDWDETGDDALISMNEFNAIGEIIALQVSFFCLRRISNACESNNDYIRQMLKEKIRLYESNYGKTFDNSNDEKLW